MKIVDKTCEICCCWCFISITNISARQLNFAYSIESYNEWDMGQPEVN
jgi:hypothetical protein